MSVTIAEQSRLLRNSLTRHPCETCAEVWRRNESPASDMRCPSCHRSMRWRWQEERREEKRAEKGAKAMPPKEGSHETQDVRRAARGEGADQ